METHFGTCNITSVTLTLTTFLTKESVTKIISPGKNRAISVESVTNKRQETNFFIYELNMKISLFLSDMMDQTTTKTKTEKKYILSKTLTVHRGFTRYPTRKVNFSEIKIVCVLNHVNILFTPAEPFSVKKLQTSTWQNNCFNM